MKLQVKLGEMCRRNLFMHAVSGCDTTSGPFGRGKRKVMKILQSNAHRRDIVDVFNKADAEHNVVARTGETFLLTLYGAASDMSSLDVHRCFMYHYVHRYR